MNTQLFENVDWVGYVDWAVRDFHGYMTRRGATYNAYLIRDRKTALIDTVKGPYAGKLLERVAALADPATIDYVVCNHAEPDHSSGLPAVLEKAPRATVVCSEKCREILAAYYAVSGWRFKTVKTGDELALGARTLRFVETPMAHWPDSMFTYLVEDRLLFSMDAFGQHYASSNRFDDEVALDEVMQEAATYYANILMLYGKQVGKALDVGAGLEIAMIAPSHGVIWRSHIDRIVAAYRDWSVLRPKPKVLVVYDTMWQSTEAMAKAIMDGANEFRTENKLIYIRSSDVTEIATEVLTAAGLAFGSSTLNMTLMPMAAATLAYLEGLRPKGKAAFAFGSYGWGSGGPEAVNGWLEKMKLEILNAPIRAKFRPDEKVLAECRAAGRALAKRALEIAG